MPIVALSGPAAYPATACRSRVRTMARGKNFNQARDGGTAAAPASPSSAKLGKATVAAKDAQRGGEEAGFEARQVVGVAVGSNAARRGDAWFGLLRFRRRTSSSFFF